MFLFFNFWNRHIDHFKKLQDLGIPLPKLDVETRWNSMIDMIISLLKYRTTYDTIISNTSPDFVKVLSANDWSKLEEYKVAMEPIRLLIVKLQRQNLTLSDFFIDVYNGELIC